MTPSDVRLHPEQYQFFEDIIDGYFPLNISIGHLMDRLGASDVVLEMTHAPIMQIPGLSHQDPVPLNIREGRAGLIERMWVYAARQQGRLLLSGVCRWHWLDGSTDNSSFDPFTRLAEPAFLEGYAYPQKPLGADGETKGTLAHRVSLDPSQPSMHKAVLNELSWDTGAFVGPLRKDGVISAPHKSVYGSKMAERCDFLVVPRLSFAA